MSEELKPCPFCGGKAELYQNEYDDTDYEKHTIQCKKCPVEIFSDIISTWDGTEDGIKQTKIKSRKELKKLIKTWNKRNDIEQERLNFRGELGRIALKYERENSDDPFFMGAAFVASLLFSYLDGLDKLDGH